MKQKTTILIALILLLLFSCEAQNIPTFYPFKGFHVGVTAQTSYIQPCQYVYLSGEDPAPIGIWTYGWEAGMEFSYHFAKYFGVSLGINYGTALSYNSKIYISTIPDIGGPIVINNYERLLIESRRENEIIFPLKLEFHYQLRNDFFFTTEVGVRIRGVGLRLDSWPGARMIYETSLSYSYIYDPERDAYLTKPYYIETSVRTLSTIYVDLLLCVGLYYKLPYGDLLRFTAGVNVSFKNTMDGYYIYDLTKSYGSFSVKHDYIYTQLSYIHTLNWQKAKKYLKQNDISFASNKERRKTIVEMLNQ